MKVLEKNKARSLRSQGFSLREIRNELKVSKGTLSVWLHDIKLTEEQKESLSERNAEAYRYECIGNTNHLRKLDRLEIFRIEALTAWKTLKVEPIFILGLGLYIGEGTKNSDSLRLANCNPSVIKQTIKFYKFLGFPEEKIRGNVAIQDGLNIESILTYWATVTGIAQDRISKTINQSKASLNKKGNIQPYGTFTVTANSVELKAKVDTWMDKALHDL